jgi:hypothetical protein
MSKKNTKSSKPAAENMASEHLKSMKDTVKQLSKLTQIKGTPEQDKIIRENAQIILNSITEFIKSDTYIALKEGMTAFYTYMEEHKAEHKALKKAGAELIALAPYLQLELEAVQEDPEYKNCTLEELLAEGFDDKGNPIKSKFDLIVERAQARQAEFNAAAGALTEIEQAAKKLPQIIANPAEKIDFPLDKPNHVIWNLLAEADKNGQLALKIDTSRKGSKQEAVVLYGINFDELPASVQITKQLTPFDKRCYIAAAALYNAGNETVTATQIYKAMGNAKTPGGDDLQKINDSLTKMGAARIYIDNQKEVEVQHEKGYKHFKYDAALLPFERMSAYINGQLTESAIHLLREPPLITFARERKQITTLSRKLLESPVSKTDANLRIDDYLIERIGHMKNPKSKAPRKMLFTTIYEECGIKTAKQKQRAPEKIVKYLEHYKKCSWIKGYEMEPDGIKILL